MVQYVELLFHILIFLYSQIPFTYFSQRSRHSIPARNSHHNFSPLLSPPPAIHNLLPANNTSHPNESWLHTKRHHQQAREKDEHSRPCSDTRWLDIATRRHREILCERCLRLRCERHTNLLCTVQQLETRQNTSLQRSRPLCAANGPFLPMGRRHSL